MTQFEALNILKTGENVFLTGAAGSGKTYVLERYISYLSIHHKKVAITASTGVAATHLNGMTINAWAGIGVRQSMSDEELVDLTKRKYLCNRFRGTQVLIIDEVSMLPAATLELIDKVSRAFKRKNEPFGGMQVVLCGDFFQLPPVTPNSRPEFSSGSVFNEEKMLKRVQPDSSTRPNFVFRSPLWKELDLQICYLDRLFRQDDEKFIHLLSQIRENSITQSTWDTLKERFTQPLEKGIIPTKLYTHNDRADAINTQELANIKEPLYIYQMQAKGNETLIAFMKKNCLAPEQLMLKKGALVMFVKNNYEEGYANGTMGKVLEFNDEGCPVVETYAGKRIVVDQSDWSVDEQDGVFATISQLPLRLAWAITIHKSQGMTLDAAEIDLGKSFVEGMGYVALSRVRTLQGMRLRSINRTALTVDQEIIRVDKRLKELSDDLSNQLKEDYWWKKNNGSGR